MHKGAKMTKQKQQQPQNDEQRPGLSRDPDQQGGRNAQAQSGRTQQSQGQPEARQSDQGGSRGSSHGGNDSAPKGSQRGQTANQQGARASGDQSVQMHETDEQSGTSSERLRKGALDAQYGTDSSSKTNQQANQPQSTQSPTGSDRDTMGGARSKGQ